MKVQQPLEFELFEFLELFESLERAVYDVDELSDEKSSGKYIFPIFSV